MTKEELFVKDEANIPRLNIQVLINLINREFVDAYVLFTPNKELKIYNKECNIPYNPSIVYGKLND